MSSPPPKLAALRSLPDLAHEVGRPRRTFFRQITELHRQDVDKGEGGWLMHLHRRKLYVNLSRLRQLHPALFETKYLSREEGEALVEGWNRTEDRQRETDRRVNAISARVREHIDQLRAELTAVRKELSRLKSGAISRETAP